MSDRYQNEGIVRTDRVVEGVKNGDVSSVERTLAEVKQDQEIYMDIIAYKLKNTSGLAPLKLTDSDGDGHIEQIKVGGPNAMTISLDNGKLSVTSDNQSMLKTATDAVTNVVGDVIQGVGSSLSDAALGVQHWGSELLDGLHRANTPDSNTNRQINKRMHDAPVD